MRNAIIHLLPTSKLTRLWTNNLRRRLELDEFPSQHPSNIAKHIYITSDEEIREGDKILNPTNEVQTCIGLEKGIGTESICWIKVKETTTLQQILNSQKIILTTDQDLDDVQKIGDEFLEWFIKNPGCEQVEVTYDKDVFPYGVETAKGYGLYKIIILQEEPKQKQKEHLIEIMRGDEELGLYEELQETLEEAMNVNGYHDEVSDTLWREGVKFGAKWQAERMYNEVDMHKAYCAGSNFDMSCLKGEQYYMFKEWFEQFKKK
jgi:hypothetical protein